MVQTTKIWKKFTANENTARSDCREFCKTWTKKSILYLFNFYVVSVLAGHDIVIETGRATTSRRKFKAPFLQKSSKNQRPSKNHLKKSNEKKMKTVVLSFYKTTSQWNKMASEATIEHGPSNQEEIN